MTSTARIVIGILLAILSGGLLLPTGIALARNHPKVVGVVLWNTVGLLLLGLGWLIALVISLTGSSAPTVVVHNHINGAGASADSAGKAN
jgi:uncharacterized membrane protein